MALKVRLGPDGVHIFDRTSGNNLLVEEVSVPENRWSKSPRQVSIALTNLCNLNCTHCYAPKNKAELNFKKIKRWLKELDENGCLGVGFGGGEPTSHPYFREICAYGSEHTDLAITFTTHGHNFTKDFVSTIQGSVNFIRISMDGVGKNYEKIRKRNFNSFLDKLSLVSGKIPFGINFVVNKATIKDLDAAVGICEKFGATELLILPEVCHGNGQEVDSITLDNLKNWVSGYKGAVKLSISEKHKDQFTVAIPLTKELELNAYAHIDANSNLKKTSFSRQGIKVGAMGVLDALEKLKIQKET